MNKSTNDNVLLGVLSGKNSREHLAWVLENNTYYMPLLREQPRQYTASWLLLYIPKAICDPGAVRYKGEIESVKILKRKEIKTPWTSHQNSPKLQVVYTLNSIEELVPPIINVDHRGKEQRISHPRWTTKLAMDRARTINELLLESESDWWIYDNLIAKGIEFRIKVRGASKEEQCEDDSRVWFMISKKGIQIRYAGELGFVVSDKYGGEKAFMHIENLFEHCFGNSKIDSNKSKE